MKFSFHSLVLASVLAWSLVLVPVSAVLAQNGDTTKTLASAQFFLERLSALSESGKLIAQAKKGPDRSLRLYNIHTKETVDVTFWSGGEYDEQGFEKLDHFLRDWRTDDVTEIDRTLYNLLFYMKLALEQDYPKLRNQPLHIISGYRSQKTNDRLLKIGRNVSRTSYHIYGQAIDVHFPGVPTAVVRDLAKKFNIGGVGYYPHNDFVHVDTGRVRYW